MLVNACISHWTKNEVYSSIKKIQKTIYQAISRKTERHTVMPTMGVLYKPRLHKIFTHSVPRLRMEYLVSLKILVRYISGLWVAWRQVVSNYLYQTPYKTRHIFWKVSMDKGNLTFPETQETNSRANHQRQFSKAWAYIIWHPWNVLVIRAEKRAK